MGSEGGDSLSCLIREGRGRWGDSRGSRSIFKNFSLNTMSLPIICCGASTPRPRWPSSDSEALLQLDGETLDRPGIDGPDVDRRLLHGHSTRAPALRRGSPQPGVSVVLPARSGWQGSRSLDILKEPAWPISRKRSVAPSFRGRRPTLHGGG